MKTDFLIKIGADVSQLESDIRKALSIDFGDLKALKSTFEELAKLSKEINLNNLVSNAPTKDIASISTVAKTSVTDVKKITDGLNDTVQTLKNRNKEIEKGTQLMKEQLTVTRKAKGIEQKKVITTGDEFSTTQKEYVNGSLQKTSQTYDFKKEAKSMEDAQKNLDKYQKSLEKFREEGYNHAGSLKKFDRLIGEFSGIEKIDEARKKLKEIGQQFEVLEAQRAKALKLKRVEGVTEKFEKSFEGIEDINKGSKENASEYRRLKSELSSEKANDYTEAQIKKLEERIRKSSDIAKREQKERLDLERKEAKEREDMDKALYKSLENKTKEAQKLQDEQTKAQNKFAETVFENSQKLKHSKENWQNELAQLSKPSENGKKLIDDGEVKRLREQIGSLNPKSDTFNNDVKSIEAEMKRLSSQRVAEAKKEAKAIADVEKATLESQRRVAEERKALEANQTKFINAENERVFNNKMALSQEEEKWNKKLAELTKDTDGKKYVNSDEIKAVQDKVKNIDTKEEDSKFKEKIKDIQSEIKNLETLKASRIKEEEKAQKELEEMFIASEKRKSAELEKEEKIRADLANKEVERIGQNTMKLKAQKDEWNKELKELDKIQDRHGKSFLTQEEVENVKSKIDRLSPKDDNFEKESAKIKGQIKELEKLNKARQVEEQRYVQELEKGFLDSNKRVEKSYKDLSDAQTKAINDEVRRRGENYIELKQKSKEFETSLDKIVDSKYINNKEAKNAQKAIKNLSHESENFKKEIRDTEKELSSLLAKIEQRKTSDINNRRKREDNHYKIDALEDSGVLNDNAIKRLRESNNSINFKTGKEDIEFLNSEIKKYEKQVQRVVKAQKEEEAVIKRKIQDEKFIKKELDAREKALKNISKNILENVSDENQQKTILREIETILGRIKSLRGETRNAVERENESLQKQIEVQKELAEKMVKDERQRISEDKDKYNINRRLNTFSHHATSGIIKDDPDALKNMNDLISRLNKQMEQTSKSTGKEFQEQKNAMIRALDEADAYSRDVNGRIRERHGTTFGMVALAMKKVPVWMGAMGAFYGVVNQVRDGIQAMFDMDMAMVNLKKVTNATNVELEHFKLQAFEIGDRLGAVASDVITVTAEFQKLGYSLKESAQLGENTLLYANVGDMNVEDAQKNIVSMIKGFGIEVDKEGNNIRKTVDIMNEVGNNFAITSEGIGEALRRSSAVLHEAGNSIEQSVALVTAANTTIQDPKKVGTASKTISMRLRGVSDEGEKIIDLVPKLEGAFQKVNNRLGLVNDEALTLKQNETTFFSTYEIFDRLSAQWHKLEDMERANLVELIGGKEQGAIVSAMINNWADAVGSYETALNSAGSAQAEFNEYKESFEYRIKRLQNALQEFWVTFFNDDAIKKMIDGLTEVVQLFTKLVQDGSIVGATAMLTNFLGVIGLFSSKRLRSFLVALSVGTKDGAKGVEGLTGSFDKLKKVGTGAIGMLGTVAKRIPAVAGYFLAITALGKGLEYVLNLMTKSERERKAHISAMRDEQEAVESLVDAYESFNESNSTRDSSGNVSSTGIDRLDELKSKKYKSPEEEVELRRLNKEISEILPEMVRYYDDYGEAVMFSTETIKAHVEALRENESALNSSLLRLEIEDFDFKNFEKGMKDRRAVADELRDFEASMEFFEELEGRMFKGVEGIASALREGKELTYDEMSEFRQAIYNSYNEVLDEMKNSYGDFELKKYQDLNKAMNQDDVNAIEEFFRTYKDGMKTELEDLNIVMEEVKTKTVEGMSEINDFINRAVQNLGHDMKSDEGQLAQKIGDYIRNNIESFSRDDIENIDTLIQGMFDEIVNTAGTYDLDLSDLVNVKLDLSGKNANDQVKEVDDYIKKTKDTIKSLQSDLNNASTASMRQELQLLISVMQDVLDKQYLLKEELVNAFEDVMTPEELASSYNNDLIPSLSRTIDEIVDLQSAYDSLNGEKQVSQQEILALVSKNSELLDSLEVVNGQLHLNKDAVRELMDAKIAEFQASVAQKREDAQNAIEHSRSVIQSIRAQIQAYEALAIAKNSAGTFLNKVSQSKVGKFATNTVKNSALGRLVSKAGNTKAGKQITGIIGNFTKKVTSNANSQITELKNKMKEEEVNLKKFQSEIERLDGLLTYDFSSPNLSSSSKATGGGKKPSGSKGKKPSGSKGSKSGNSEKELQDAVYIIHKYAESMDILNTALEKNNILKERQRAGSQIRKKYVQEEIDLLHQQRKATNQEIASLKKQIKEREILKYGMISLNEKEDNSTERKKIAELNQEIHEAIQNLRKLEVDTMNVAERIRKLRVELMTVEAEEEKMKRDNLRDDIAYLKYIADIYDNTTEKYHKAKQAELAYSQQLLESHQKELAILEQAKADTKAFINDSDLQELNKAIRDKREDVFNASKEAINLQNEIAKSVLARFSELARLETREYTKAVEELNLAISELEDLEGDPSVTAQKIEKQKEILALKKGELADARRHVETLKEMLKANEGNYEAYKAINSELEMWEDKVTSLQGAVVSSNKAIKDEYKAMADRVVEIYKEQLELQRKAEEEYHKNRTDAEKKAHENRMRQLDRELEAIEKAYEIQNRKLDSEKSEDKFKDEVDRSREEILEIQREIDLLSMDDSYEAEKKRSALKKKLLEKERALKDKENDYSYDQRQKQLDADLQADKDRIKSQKDMLEAQFNNWLENEEAIYKKRKEYLDKQVADEREMARIRKMIMEGNFEDMTTILEGWGSNVEANMEQLGDVVTRNFTDKIKEAIDSLNSLTSMNVGSYQDSVAVKPIDKQGSIKVPEKQNGELEDISKRPQPKPETKVPPEDKNKKPSSSSSSSSSSSNASATPKGVATAKVKAQLYSDEKLTKKIETVAKGSSWKYYGTKGSVIFLGGKKYGRTADFTLSSGGGSSSSSSGNRYRTTGNLYLRDAPNMSGKIITTMPKHAQVEVVDSKDKHFYKVKYNGKTGFAGKGYIQQFDTGGYTGDWSSKEGKLAVLHQKELVLNETQTGDMLKVFKIFEKIKSFIRPNAKMSGNINSNSSDVKEVNHYYKAEVNIERFNGDRDSAESVAEETVKKMKRTKGGIF